MFESKKLAEWIEKQTEVNESVADLLSGFMDEITELKKQVNALVETHHTPKAYRTTRDRMSGNK